jgi:hypothetical protein
MSAIPLRPRGGSHAHSAEVPEEIAAQFRAAVSTTHPDLVLPETEPLIASGKWESATALGDHNPNKFWYVFHLSPVPHAVYGHWVLTGSKPFKWTADEIDALAPEQIAALAEQGRAFNEELKRQKDEQVRQRRPEVFSEYMAARPAPADFPYVVRKGIDVPPGVRLVEHRFRESYRSGFTKQEHTRRGSPQPALMIPLRTIEDERLQTAEYISADGDKDYAYGLPTRGACYIYGEFDPTRPVYLAEGIATAGTVHQLTGCMTIRCGSAGNFRAVLLALRGRYGDTTRLVVCAERGNGYAQAVAAAAQYSALVSTPPFAEGDEGTDYNDFWKIHGDDATREAIVAQIGQPDAAEAADAGGDAGESPLFRAWVDSINKEFALVERWGIDAAFARFEDDGDPLPVTDSTLRMVLADRGFRRGDKQPHLIWQRSPSKRKYRRAAFDPEWAFLDRERDLNLWRGFAVQPAPGDWSLYRRLVEDVIAGGDRRVAEYLLNYLAHLVQRPGTRTNVALVLYGPQGVGKNTFTGALLRIFGPHAIELSDRNMLVGEFTGHLENKVLIGCDEMSWAGDHTFQERLKTAITAATVQVHYKGHTPFDTPNTRNVMLTTNHEHAIRIEPGDRRFCVINVTDPFAGLYGEEQARARSAYFDPLYAQMEAGGYAALLHDLLARDLTGFDVRAYPRTAAHAKQAELSLSPVERWLVAALRAGTYAPALGPTRGQDTAAWGAATEAEKRAVFSDYEAFCKNAGLRHYPGDSLFWDRLRTLMGDRLPQRQLRQGTHRPRVVTLPPLAVARERVRLTLGIPPFEEDEPDVEEPAAP